MKKGFTLVELLAVVSVLAILLALIVPTAIRVINDSKQKSYDLQVNSIKTAAKFYIEDNKLDISELDNVGGIYYITLGELATAGYIEGEIINPLTNDLFEDDFIINVRVLDNHKLKYGTGELPWVFEVTIPSGGDTFSFGAANADLIIDWGDGIETSHSYTGDDYISHSYAEGVYDVTVDGTSNHIAFCNLNQHVCSSTTPEYLTDIKTKIPISLGLTDTTFMFSFVNLINVTATDFFDEASANITNMGSMFNGAGLFDQDISGWDVSNVTNMGHMFYQADSFNQDISGWDVSNVTDMGHMFCAADSFNKDISGWDVSNVTDMNYMFYSADSFNQDISGWDTSNVTDMSYMFAHNSVFNQDLSGWCVSNILSEPTNFDTSAAAWSLPRPVWGTCP